MLAVVLVRSLDQDDQTPVANPRSVRICGGLGIDTVFIQVKFYKRRSRITVDT